MYVNVDTMDKIVTKLDGRVEELSTSGNWKRRAEAAVKRWARNAGSDANQLY